MKLLSKLVIAPLCFFSFCAALVVAADREIEFSAKSSGWNTDAYNKYSSSYDVSVVYYDSGSLDSWNGWKDDFPTESYTNSSKYIEDGDDTTYAAQWDSSATPRTNWDPSTTSSDRVVFY